MSIITPAIIKKVCNTICRYCEKNNKNRELPVITEKICMECKNNKTVDNFIKHKSNSDGYVNTCKECSRAIENNRRKMDKVNNVRFM